MGLFVFGAGIPGGIIFSLFLTWKPEFLKKSAYLICITAIASLAFFYLVTIREDEILVYIACGVLGFFLLPILFVAYELAVESTVKDGVGETMSCGLINVVANFAGFLMALALQPELATETKDKTMIAIIVLFANLGLSLMFLILGDICEKKKDAAIEKEFANNHLSS